MSDNNSNTNGNSMNENGGGLPSVIEYITQSGIIVHITPLSLFTIQAITNKSEQVLPYPDEANYREASDLVASGFIPASENETYQALCKEVDAERSRWQESAILELACKYPQWESRADMIATFRGRLEELRPYLELHKDDWRNVLEHCVFTGYADVAGEDNQRLRTTERYRVVRIARQNANLALSMPEVIDGMKLFRVQLSGDGAGILAGRASRSGKRD